MRFGQNVLRIIWKERFVQFSWKAHCFPFLERIWGQCDNFHHFDAHECDLAKTCSAWPEKRVLYNFHEKHTVSLFGENLRPVWQFSPLWRSQCDLAKTCCAWSEKSVLYNFHEKRTVFPFWREFEASVTIFTTLTLTSAIWPKRAAHDLKRGFCTIFMKSALFSLFGENWGQCDANKCDFAKTCWACPKKTFCIIFMESALFSRFEENLRQV